MLFINDTIVSFEQYKRVVFKQHNFKTCCFKTILFEIVHSLKRYDFRHNVLVCWFKTVQFKKLSQKKEALAGFEPTDVGTVASASPSELPRH